MPDLEERVAALEDAFAMMTFPLLHAPLPPMSAEDEARFTGEFKTALRDAAHRPLRILPSPPPLTPDEVRHLLRESVTVVKPGETLVIRDRDWTPNQVREIQRWMDEEHESGRISFKVLVIIGEELGVAEPEP